MKIHIDLDKFGSTGAFSINKDIAKLNGFYLPRSAITNQVLSLVMDKRKNGDGSETVERTNFVYFLLNINEAKDIKRMIYIGETTDLPTRVTTHKKNRQWWNVMVVFSNTDLEETDINAIERILIGEYEDSDLYKVDNDQHPHKPIKDYHYEYSEYIVSIMDFLSYGITTSVINEVGDEKSNKPVETPKDDDKVSRRPRFKFSMIGLKAGDIVTLDGDDSQEFAVYDEERVLYKGEPWKLSPLAEKLLTDRKPPLQGPKYFRYNGETLDDIRNRYEGIVVEGAPKTDNWLIACNKNYYDLDRAYSELKVIDYKQTANIKAGSKVYIYVSKPDRALAYETEAIVVNKPAQTIDDSAYVLDSEGYSSCNRYMELKLVRKLNPEGLSLSDLKSHGLTGNLQGPCRTTVELQKYIDEILKKD